MTDAESGKKLNELHPKRYEKARQAEGTPASGSGMSGTILCPSAGALRIIEMISPAAKP